MAGDNETLKQRSLIVLLSSEERYRVPEIAPMVGLHVDKVRKWVIRFNKHGLKGLQPPRRKPGPRGKFDQDMRTHILEIASTPPRQLGQLRTSWTLDSPSRLPYLERHGRRHQSREPAADLAAR